jgi:hypothetical protein
VNAEAVEGVGLRELGVRFGLEVVGVALAGVFACEEGYGQYGFLGNLAEEEVSQNLPNKHTR